MRQRRFKTNWNIYGKKLQLLRPTYHYGLFKSVSSTSEVLQHSMIHGGQELNLVKYVKPRDHWGDQDVDGRIILRRIFRKWERVVGTGWSWLRIGTGGGLL